MRYHVAVLFQPYYIGYTKDNLEITPEVVITDGYGSVYTLIEDGTAMRFNSAEGIWKWTYF